MKQRFFWNRERITFFRDAAEHSSFFPLLAGRIATALHAEDHVLDAGCGLGYLSRALLPYCKSVTAVDCDPGAVSELRERTAGTEGLYPVEADVYSIPLHCDVIVCCRFGSTEEALRLFAGSDAHTLVLIKRNAAGHRIAASGPEHTRTADDAARVLNEKGIPYTSQSVSIPFDQPFRSKIDAVRFLASYLDRTPDRSETDAFLARLGKTDDPVFPLILPIPNDLRCFFIHRA